ncbi:unnamed protein product [Phytomonas sp. Hart1]|nr:unnamed protein product [Phytomonas sp. Hart1]|eukprot:CCW67265.1 unnamed protein product [Phytomonas sp. isolate Hart1]
MPTNKDIFIEDAGESYRVMTLVDFRELRDLALSNSPSWTTHLSGKILVQSKPSDDKTSKLNIIRGKGIMERVPPDVLYNQLHDSSYRAVWDSNMLESCNVVKLNSHNDIGYYAAKFPWPLKNRDFCNMRSWMEFTNGEFIIFNHSVTHNKCPVKKGFIRAKSILSGYYIRPHNDGSELIYVTHSDPCGSISHAIINFFMTKGAPMLLNNCEKSSEKYPEFVATTYPPGYQYPWSTPKMDWDSELLYPEDEPVIVVGSSEKPSEESTDANSRTEYEAEIVSKASTPSHCVVDSKVIEVPSSSLAAMPSTSCEEPVSFQQYRALMQDALIVVDQYFLREKRTPSTRDYIIRLMSIIDEFRNVTEAT